MMHQLFVGTKIGGKNSYVGSTGSKGIYSLKFDDKKGELFQTSEYDLNQVDPTFLAIKDNILYAVNERLDIGKVCSFRVNSNGSLKLIDTIETEGSMCCHISVDDFGPFIFCANYMSGNIFVLKSTEGKLSLTDKKQHYGQGINPERQDGPKAHACVPTTNGKGVLVCDLGIDKIINYILDRETGLLQLNSNQPFTEVKPGEGPRHLIFNPEYKYIYLLTELGSHIYVYKYDENTMVLSKVQVISTIPSGFKGETIAAEIIITKNGKYLYTSNRGLDTIAAFYIEDEGGRLLPLGNFDCGGSTPWHITLTPNESYIISSNTSSNCLSVIKRNETSGKLSKIISEFSIPAPTCVVWKTKYQ